MPILHFTDANVRDLPAPTRRTDYFDDVVTGLCLRVTPAGVKTWAVLYRAHGRLRRLTLKRYPALLLADARKAARKALIEVGLGKDPAADKVENRTILTFNQLADLYLERYAKPRKRTWMDDARQLRVFCRPRWGSGPATAVTRDKVRELLAHVSTDRSGTVANRLQACLSKLFSWAVAEGFLVDHAVRGLSKAQERGSRARVLADEELRTIWRELDQGAQLWAETGVGQPHPPRAINPDVVFWMRLRLLTAQRGGEVADLRWADVDLARGQWEIPGTR